MQQKNDYRQFNIFHMNAEQEEQINKQIRIKNRAQLIEYIKKVRRKLQNKIKNIDIKNNEQGNNFYKEFGSKSSNLSGIRQRIHRNYYKLYQTSNKNQKSHLNKINKSKFQQSKKTHNQRSQLKYNNSWQNIDSYPNNQLKQLKQPQKIKKTKISSPKNIMVNDSINNDSNKEFYTQNSLSNRTHRQNSLPSVINRKKYQNIIKSTRYNQHLKTQLNPQSKYPLYMDSTRAQIYQLGNYFLKIPKNRQARTTQQFIPLLKHLKQYNKIFIMLAQQLALCLLRIGIYYELYPGDVLYDKNHDRKSFYIILCGVIAIINGNINMKKMIYTGESLAQQMLFGNIQRKKVLDAAQSVTKTYVLEIRVKDYEQVRNQAKKYGFYRQFQQFEDYLRNQFTTKNISRNVCLINRQNLFYT